MMMKTRLALFVPILALCVSAQAATPKVSAAKAVGANAAGQIIALPLNPVVPANMRSCAARTTSGLGYTQLQAPSPAGPAARTGVTPGATDVVLINYIGYLAAGGQVFDQAMATPMPVSEVISGFSEGLKLIPKGSTWRICIPAVLGYGAQAQGPIPANSDLVFQIELLDFKTAAEIEAMRKAHGPDVAGSAPVEPSSPEALSSSAGPQPAGK